MQYSSTPGWERETPKYQAAFGVNPSPKSRHRFEPPFGMTTDASLWQYAERPIKAGEEIETTAWPHPSFIAMNYAAQRVLDFFKNRQKSRLPLSPCDHNGQVRLDDGLGGAGPTLKIVRLEPVRLAPGQIGPRL